MNKSKLKTIGLAVGLCFAVVGAGVAVSASSFQGTAVEAKAVGTAAGMAHGTNASDVTVNGKTAVKVGTSSKGGDMKITVGAGATKLSFYAAAWKGVSGLSLNLSGAAAGQTSFELTADSGVSGSSSSFTLSGNEESYLFETTLSGIDTETVITLTSSIAKRFVVWNPTYEVASAPVEPGVHSIELDKDAISLSSIGSIEPLTATVDADEVSEEVAWSSSDPTVAVYVDGNVKALKVGTATITAKAVADETKTASCQVTVGKAVLLGAETENMLNNSVVGDTTSYIEWTAERGENSYKGQSAGANTSIQLRSSNSNSGIVMTKTSGACAYRVSVVWEDHTSGERYLDVYGKDTAYTDPTDLYNASTSGDKIGTIASDDETTDFSVYYPYIGLRSRSGAMYLTSITIHFSEAASSAAVTEADAFVADYMHLDYVEDEGKCKTEGYFSDAKAAFNALSEDASRVIIESESDYAIVGEKTWKYSDVKARLLAWAAANGSELNPDTGKLSAAIVNETPSAKTSTVVVLAAVFGVTAALAGSLLFFRKRKEN